MGCHICIMLSKCDERNIFTECIQSVIGIEVLRDMAQMCVYVLCIWSSLTGVNGSVIAAQMAH